MTLAGCLLVMPWTLMPGSAGAQDVPGIEICTVEKTMERRTSCLQSNVDFLQKTIGKLGADHRQKLDAAKAQIEGLKSTVVGLQRTVEELQAAQKKTKCATAAARKRRCITGERWREVVHERRSQSLRAKRSDPEATSKKSIASSQLLLRNDAGAVFRLLA